MLFILIYFCLKIILPLCTLGRCCQIDDGAIVPLVYRFTVAVATVEIIFFIINVHANLIVSMNVIILGWLIVRELAAKPLCKVQSLICLHN